MRTIGLVEKLDFVTLGKILSRAVALPTILCGVAMLTVFFGLFLLLLSWADLSYVLPLLSVSYVVNVILARAVLHEIVPVTRWLGVLTICFGVYYMSSTWNGEIQQRDSAEATD
ncbi:MAG: EamA family transporter [Acidobacteria bacterium]|nr:EamA family transporter [Acidobacteriota bacterium]